MNQNGAEQFDIAVTACEELEQSTGARLCTINRTVMPGQMIVAFMTHILFGAARDHDCTLQRDRCCCWCKQIRFKARNGPQVSSSMAPRSSRSRKASSSMPGSLRARRRRPRPGAQLPVSTSARRTIQLTVSIAGTLRPSRVWAEITAENRVVELRSSAFGSAGRQAMRRTRA